MAESKKFNLKEFLFGSKKRRIISIAVAIAIVVASVGAVFCLSNPESFFTIASRSIRKEVGVFRYEFSVDSSDLSSSFKVDDDSTDAQTEDETSSVEVPVIANQGNGTGVNSGAVVSDTWGNADGTRDIDWSYPKFTIVLSGQITSVDPVELKCVVSIDASDYSSNFTTITVKDGACYISLDEMRTWLTSYGDEELMRVGKFIPSSVVNLKIDNESDLKLFSPYANILESGTSGTLEAYRRLQAVGNTILGALKTLDKGTSKDGDAYLVNITDAESISALESIKNMTNRFGNYYTNYIDRVSSYGGANETSLGLLEGEKANFMTHMSKFWVAMNTMDLVDMDEADFALSGRAREYATGGSEELTQESAINLVFSNVLANRSYSVTVKTCKMPISTAKSDILVPDGATASLDQIGGITGLNNIFGEVSNYFDVFDLVKDSSWQDLDDISTAISKDADKVEDLTTPTTMTSSTTGTKSEGID